MHGVSESVSVLWMLSSDNVQLQELECVHKAQILLSTRHYFGLLHTSLRVPSLREAPQLPTAAAEAHGKEHTVYRAPV